MNQHHDFTNTQVFFLVFLRIAIGWHFLYEGLIKLFTSSWTASGYLMDSKGLLAPMFKSMASNAGLLSFVDHLNEWGLILIGLGLILGLFTRAATVAGMILLAFYYLSHPPLIMYSYALPSEGSFFIVDKIMIEFIALGVLYSFRTVWITGLDRLRYRNKVKYSEDGRKYQ
jgi:thiosulfate dehydrogenase [quinone] large subunit